MEATIDVIDNNQDRTLEYADEKNMINETFEKTIDGKKLKKKYAHYFGKEYRGRFDINEIKWHKMKRINIGGSGGGPPTWSSPYLRIRRC